MTLPGMPGIVQVPDSVFISDDALETIEENAFAEAPLECCGLLLGRFAPPDPPPAPPGPLRLVKGANPANPTDQTDQADPTDAEDAAAAIEEELGLVAEGGGGAFDIPLPNVLTVEEAIPTRNASPEPTKYLVEPEDHFRVLRDARSRGLDIVGAYHSHVITQPVPSETDLKRSASPFPLRDCLAGLGHGRRMRRSRLVAGRWELSGSDHRPSCVETMKPSTLRAAGVLGVAFGVLLLLTPVSGGGGVMAAGLGQDEPPVERPRSAAKKADTAKADTARADTARDDEARREALLRVSSGGDRVRVGGGLYVGENERVRKAIAVFGRAEVNGIVEEVVAIGGDVVPGPRAMVRRDDRDRRHRPRRAGRLHRRLHRSGELDAVRHQADAARTMARCRWRSGRIGRGSRAWRSSPT